VGRPHHHARAEAGPILYWSLALTVVFVAVEAVAGFRSGSLALVSDAGHNLTDAFGLMLAAAAVYFQLKPGNRVKTFGYHRAEVLAAFLNALFLVVISAWLLWESYQRLLDPQPIAEITMLVVACIGLALNLGIAWGLGAHRGSLNIRAAFLHQIGDAASCAGIIVGAVVIRYTGWLWVDPALSMVIGVAIIWTAWDIFRDSLNILLEGSPKGIDVGDVTREILAVDGVIDVHHLHIWSLGSEAHALSCHVLIEDAPPSASGAILRRVNTVLCERFAIDHTTIQFEHTRCALADEACTVVNHEHHHHAG
jgi:cobalt-zinc-cadmium efflux system protein